MVWFASHFARPWILQKKMLELWQGGGSTAVLIIYNIFAIVQSTVSGFLKDSNTTFGVKNHINLKKGFTLHSTYF